MRDGLTLQIPSLIEGTDFCYALPAKVIAMSGIDKMDVNPNLKKIFSKKTYEYIQMHIQLSQHATGFAAKLEQNFDFQKLQAAQTAKETFEAGGLGLDLPEIQIKLSEIKKGLNFLDLLSKNKIISSKSEARRVIANKGLKIDNVVVVDENIKIVLSDFKNNVLKISYGKKKHYLIKII